MIKVYCCNLYNVQITESSFTTNYSYKQIHSIDGADISYLILQMREMLSPLRMILPIFLRAPPFFRLTSSASSSTVFMYSSKPMILPSMRKSAFSQSQISTRDLVQKNLQIRNYRYLRISVYNYNRPDHELLELSRLIFLHYFM